MPGQGEIKRSEIQHIANDYDLNNIHIGIFGSHSALPVGFAAKKANIPSLIFTKKGREKTYAKYNRTLYDDVIVIEEWEDMLSEETQEMMRRKNVVFIPNRSFVVYVGLKQIESEFLIPIYGSRKLLRSEERTAPPPRNQYYLLKQANIRTPKLFESPDEIDRLSVVKVQQKDNPLERAYFYPSNPEEYYKVSEKKIKAGEISEEGLRKAAIEEFVIGPMLNANFHSYALNLSDSQSKFPNDFDLVGFSDREQTNETGFRRLPADIQMELSERGFRRTNEEICHRGKTLRESKLEMVYENAEKLMKTLKEEVPPGMIGPIGIQGAVPIDEKDRPEFVIFDLSFRVPGDPAIGPTSPYLRYLDVKHEEEYAKFMPSNWKIKEPLDLSMMEIKRAIHEQELEKIVT
ncbi:hypothetical protein AKJ43_00085 [candidate division MSBL1 archaeon SCGC-AAA261D19]|uniref:5-formaminoimidazole-4-carboxamide-1-(Beta)-D-ribofuranosyl 5'-monophosphate synthetase n=1 Tax=candidate division MSBL1 archaeon SCGC-AAA261D19 TaxID=1698273 RepID=A0A133V8U5_9EURY|nr:hypothetical protein AKJ43_00085 [candidate division MSBL1 archaeon SCGC-AAA261D19]